MDGSTIPMDLYWEIKDFYRVYMRYPTMKELYEFCWDHTNRHYDYQFHSIKEYKKTCNGYIPSYGTDSLLYLLMNYRNELILKENKNDGDIHLLWKPTNDTLMIAHLDPGLFMQNWGWDGLIFQYDKTGKVIYGGTFVDDIQSLTYKVSKTYTENKGITQRENGRVLMRYDRKNKLKIYCSPDIDSTSLDINYLKALEYSVDTFMASKKIPLIQFVTFVPSNETNL